MPSDGLYRVTSGFIPWSFIPPQHRERSHPPLGNIGKLFNVKVQYIEMTETNVQIEVKYIVIDFI